MIQLISKLTSFTRAFYDAPAMQKKGKVAQTIDRQKIFQTIGNAFIVGTGIGASVQILLSCTDTPMEDTAGKTFGTFLLNTVLGATTASLAYAYSLCSYQYAQTILEGISIPKRVLKQIVQTNFTGIMVVGTAMLTKTLLMGTPLQRFIDPRNTIETGAMLIVQNQLSSRMIQQLGLNDDLKGITNISWIILSTLGVAFSTQYASAFSLVCVFQLNRMIMRQLPTQKKVRFSTGVFTFETVRDILKISGAVGAAAVSGRSTFKAMALSGGWSAMISALKQFEDNH